jgi:hypothetical protein
VVTGALALPLVTVLAMAEGVRTRRRRRQDERPRVLWGPNPVINIRYWSRAMTAMGYDSTTFVTHVPHIAQRADFDVHWDEFLARVPRATPIRDFVVFAWALRRADVFVHFFDRWYLGGTALSRLEPAFLRLAGKKVIALPYGGDIAVVGELGVAEKPLLLDYPEIPSRSDATRRRVLHVCRWADVVIRNYQYGFLPRADVFWPTVLAIDVDEWMPSPDGARGGDGHEGDVVVVHAPNHRHIKGTQSLIDAVAQLRSEGLKVKLDLLEGRPNEQVKAAVQSCDIVADQFIAGYALFAIEGMSAGKPVMSALSWMPEQLRSSPALRACPIVDTDTETLATNLRALVEDPSRRARLGLAGRQFVLDHHAYAPVSRNWAALIEHAWRGAPLPSELLPETG